MTINVGEAATRYVDLLKKSKEIDKELKQLKESLISWDKEGIKSDDYGIRVIKTERIDLNKSIKKWELSGKPIPQKLIPEIPAIPAHNEPDTGLVEYYLKNKDEYKDFVESKIIYQIRQKKGKK